MRRALSFLIGLVFGLGLCISGMNLPSKVQGFLDLSGAWDPSLAFVMGGAVAIGFDAFSAAKRWKTALFGEPIRLPASNRVDGSLLIGSAIFGVGWGLAGVCPGPAIVNLAYFDPHALTFFVAMLAGMAIERAAPHLRPRRGEEASEQEA